MNNVRIGPRTDRQGEPDAAQPSSRRFERSEIDQGEEHDSGRVLDFGDHPVELRRRAHQRIDMFDRSDALILRRGGARGGDQRFAGRIRNQMEMEIAAAQCGPHGTEKRGLVITGPASCGQAWKVDAGPPERSPRPRQGPRDDPQARRPGQNFGDREEAGMNCGDNIYQGTIDIYDPLGILNKSLIAVRRRLQPFAPPRPSAPCHEIWIALIMCKPGV